jgi:hypothetical protein
MQKLSGVVCAMTALVGCAEPPAPPPPPSPPVASAAPSSPQIREDSKRIVIAKLKDIADHPVSFEFSCTGARPGSSAIPCNLDDPLLRSHLARFGQIGQLVGFVFQERRFRLESWFHHAGDL